jgi:hypothetical protein
MKNEILNKLCQEIEMTKNEKDVERFCELWDTAIEEHKMSDPFFRAYLESYCEGLEVLTFWGYWYLLSDIPEILESCKRFGVKEFAIAQQRTDLLALVKKFMDLGCEIVGIETIKIDGVVVPALKLKVGQ